MAAFSMPLPIPPRTPTPPTPMDPSLTSDERFDAASLAPSLGGWTPADPTPGSPGFMSFNTPLQSPTGPFHNNSNNIMQSMNGPPSPRGKMMIRPPSPLSMQGPPSPGLPESRSTPSPFNFTQMPMTPGERRSSTSKPNQRRGHKYKHSSVSVQFFQEPPKRPELTVPKSLPIPDFKEYRRSMTSEQKKRLGWCMCHVFVAMLTWWSAEGSLSITALSHLIFYDALSATLCVVVDILGNFDMWRKTSLRHPFGLERAEVLAGFAMSVLLLFMGFDLISHAAEDIVEGLQGEEEHHHAHQHKHDRVSAGAVDFVALAAIASTLISAFLLDNHTRIGKVMRFTYMKSLPSILSNPSHFLTLSCSGVLLMLPLLSITIHTWLDRVLSVLIGILMGVIGARLVKVLGSILLMRFSGDGISGVIRELESDVSVLAVDEAKFWQVHYNLCMANIKIRTRSSAQSSEKMIRDRVNRLVGDRLGGAYGSNRLKWEVTVDITPA